MAMWKKSTSAVLAAGLLAFASASWSISYLYRYVNEEGVTVIDYTIPPHFVHKGYEILNRDGTVHEVVPRALTAEELADRSSEAYMQQVEAEDAERMRKWDESLLLRYSTVEDVQAASDRAVSELRIRISILRSNVRSLKQQVEGNQARAADIERSGGQVPVEVVAAIRALQGEIAETERSIDERGREIEVMEQGFKRDLDRFSQLLDMVEMRKRYTRNPD